MIGTWAPMIHGNSAREELEHDDSICVAVGLDGAQAVDQILRGDVAVRAHHGHRGAGAGDLCDWDMVKERGAVIQQSSSYADERTCKGLGKAEIRDACGTKGVDEHVGALEIPAKTC